MNSKNPKKCPQYKKSRDKAQEKFARKFPYRTYCRVPEALGGHEDDHLTEGSAAPAEDVGANEIHSSQRAWGPRFYFTVLPEPSAATASSEPTLGTQASEPPLPWARRPHCPHRHLRCPPLQRPPLEPGSKRPPSRPQSTPFRTEVNT
ncbi:hypothetical protein GH733_003103, partial [Mirounga leonina]